MFIKIYEWVNRAFSTQNNLKYGFSDPKNLYYDKINAHRQNIAKIPPFWGVLATLTVICSFPMEDFSKFGISDPKNLNQTKSSGGQELSNHTRKLTGVNFESHKETMLILCVQGQYLGVIKLAIIL